tara:strand:+ start:1977 stop:2420 length:444 start_codon:yes stop_codon:yes gene_type:complete
MSKELNQYLRSVPVYQFRLVDGTTILAKLIDIDDSNNVHLEDPHEVHLQPSHDIFDVAIHKYMFMSDEREITISLDSVISHSEANLQTKDFYTKAILQTRIRDMVGELKKEHTVDTSAIFKSFIDGLDNLDSRPKFGKKPWPPEEDI